MRLNKYFVITIITFLTLLFNQKIYPQAKFNDSLAKISFDELYFRYEKNIYDTVKSSIYAKKYLQMAKINKDKYDLVCGYSMMAGRREYNLGVKYLDTMLTIAKGYDKSMVTYSYLRIGQFNTNNRRLKEALNFFLLAYKNINSKEDPYLKEVKYGIAIVKSIMGKYDEALSFFLESEKDLQDSKDVGRYKSVVFALSNAYFRLNKIENAEYYTNKGLELTKKEYRNITHQLFISNRGKNYYKRNKYILAIKDLKNTLPVIKKGNDYANYAENCYFIGKSYIKLNDSQRALVYFNKIDSIFNKKQYIFPDIISSFNHLIEDSKKNKNLSKSLYYTNQLLKADSVINQNYNYITNTAHKEYDIPELLLDKEVLIQQLESRSHKTTLFYLFTIFIIIALFGVYFKKRKRETEKQKILFEEYITTNNNSSVINENKIVIDKINTIEIDDSLVSDLIIKLKKFESSKGFLADVTLDSLSKKLGTNTSYLSMVINSKKKVNFPNYINNLRIDYIINLLQNDKKYIGYSIKALAFEAGFNSVQSFTRAFVAKTGVKASYFINQLKIKRFQNV